MEVLYSLHRQQKWHIQLAIRKVQGLMSRYVGERGCWCLPDKSFYTTVFDGLPSSSMNFTTYCLYEHHNTATLEVSVLKMESALLTNSCNTCETNIAHSGKY